MIKFVLGDKITVEYSNVSIELKIVWKEGSLLRLISNDNLYYIINCSTNMISNNTGLYRKIISIKNVTPVNTSPENIVDVFKSLGTYFQV